MKAVLRNTVIGLLCLVTVVLAAPHQSTSLTAGSRLSFEPSQLMQTACGMKDCVARNTTPAAPVVHESASFLYW